MFEAFDKQVFDKFRGLFDRGREEACPSDYLLECDNFVFERDSVKVRRGQTQIGHNTEDAGGGFPLGSFINEIFNVAIQTAEAGEHSDKYLISMTGLGGTKLYYTGKSYSVAIFPTATTTAPTWTGAFNAIQIGSRVYIMLLDGVTPMLVWDVTWLEARLAAGDPTGGGQIGLAEVPLIPDPLSFGTVGIDPGFHIVAVLYETNTGYITDFENHAGINIVGASSAISVTGIPIGPAEVISRHLIATKILPKYDGKPHNPEYFFIPEGEIKDNTTTTFPNLNWLDAALVDSADDYINQLHRIPNARRLTLYNGRLVVVAPVADRNAIYLSKIGEPESFDSVNSILISEPSTFRGIEDVAEHRGNLYIFRDNSTQVTQDDDANPNEWKVLTVDKSHGIIRNHNAFYPSTAVAQYNHQPVAINGQLICFSHGGLHVFDGSFGLDLAWAIHDKVEHLMNPTVIICPSVKLICIGDNPYTVYVGDYVDGLTPELIRWGNITLNSHDASWKDGGLYQLYGDGHCLAACSWTRIIKWARESPVAYDTVTNGAGAEVKVGNIKMTIRFPLIYPDDGWVYQFNEIVTDIKAPAVGTFNLSVGGLVSGLNVGNFVINPGVQRRWFNFKEEACTVKLLYDPAPTVFEPDIKNVLVSFKRLWGMRPRSSAVPAVQDANP